MRRRAWGRSRGGLEGLHELLQPLGGVLLRPGFQCLGDGGAFLGGLLARIQRERHVVPHFVKERVGELENHATQNRGL